ncbi:hypothetical protein DERF_006736 [Dermatophagoides farinae]|uniref:Uncharacterized protein n=1 Tax=Dermatophagoides farinae TaxID=6954 RepID=A0A922L2D7_DERFA|nr:hypothetical protein DERF_006736 [Dermatophagoides farinae]
MICAKKTTIVNDNESLSMISRHFICTYNHHHQIAKVQSIFFFEKKHVNNMTSQTNEDGLIFAIYEQ